MMGKTETGRDRDQTNMARLWIGPPYFIALVCVGFMCGWMCPPRSMGNKRRRWRDREGHQRSEATKRRGQYERRTRLKVRDAANGSLT